MWLPIVGLFLGFLIGNAFSFTIPPMYAKYMSVAILASLDSVFGGIKSLFEDRYDSKVLLTGFFFNTLLAGSLAYIGDRLGVDLYYAAIFAFGVRVFQNLAIIRHYIMDRLSAKKKPRRKPFKEKGLNEESYSASAGTISEPGLTAKNDITVGSSDG